VIIQQNQPLTGILTVKTPGIQFFIGQPVLDIFYQRYLFKDDLFFTWNNLTSIINVLLAPKNHIISPQNISVFEFSFRYIIVPSYENLYYNLYINSIKNKSLLFRSLEIDPNFEKIYENSEFKLYEVKS